MKYFYHFQLTLAITKTFFKWPVEQHSHLLLILLALNLKCGVGAQESTSGSCSLGHWAPHLFLMKVRGRLSKHAALSITESWSSQLGNLYVSSVKRQRKEVPLDYWHVEIFSIHKVDQVKKKKWCISLPCYSCNSDLFWRETRITERLRGAVTEPRTSERPRFKSCLWCQQLYNGDRKLNLWAAVPQP